jgi:membrane-associated phospholipid phosphatase
MFALVVLAYFFADRAISTYSHDMLHRPAWAVFITKLAGVKIHLGVALLGLVVAVVERWVRGKALSGGWWTLVGACVAIVLATLAVTVLKAGFGRTWPETWVDGNPSWITNHVFGFQPFHGGQGYESFPSGHTTRMTAPFAVLWARVLALRVLWVVPTLAVMVGLLVCDFHWCSDCLAGIWLGAAVAWVVVRLLPKEQW